MKLTRYWFEFVEPIESELRRSFGVSAWNYDDALHILRSSVHDFHQLQLTQSMSDVDVTMLDPNHVLPNMGIWSVRGIWFPKGYQ